MIKKTYIPGKPRNPKLTQTTGTAGVSKTEFNNVAGSSHEHYNKGVLDQITEAMLISALRELITSTDTTSELTDENILSALRVLSEISKANVDLLNEIKSKFLSKVEPDTAQKLIKFVEGIEVGTFNSGQLGSGAAIKMLNGTSYAEVDHLTVRQKATFRELIIESLKHIGGQLTLSPARMKCNKVVDGGTYYKCYFDTGDGKVSNEFVAGDQARCQVFTGSGVKMYWRLVTSVGTDWINLSKTDAISGSSIPEAGDDIVQLGHRTDTTRQNAQILSTVGVDAPSWKQYKGINAFSLEGKDTTVFSGTGNKIDGKTVFMSSGANVEDGINSKNSNYDSQPTSYKANDTWTLSADTTVNGIAYKQGDILTATQDSTTYNQAHWAKKIRYTDDSAVDNFQIGKNLFRGKNGRPLSLVGAGTTPPTIELVQMDTPFGNEAYKITFPANNNTGYVGSRAQTNNIQMLPLTTYSYSTYVYTPDDNLYGLYIYPTGGYGLSNLVRETAKDIDNWRCYNREGVVTPNAEGVINDYLVYYANTVFAGQKVFYVAGVKFEQRDKTSYWSPAPEDVQAEITAAKQEALVASNTVQTNVNNLNTYVTGAFKDGLIDEAEAKAIEKYKNTINETMARTEASFAKVFANTYLEGAAKTALENAKINLWGQRDTLLSTINNAIADGKTTIAEKNAVDSAFNTFNTLMSAFQNALEDANKAIQAKLDAISKGYVDNLQIGGVNLINGTAMERTVDNLSGGTNAQIYAVNYVFKRNSEYTLSYDIKGTGLTSVLIGNYNFPVTSLGSNGKIGSDDGGNIIFDVTPDWSRIWVKYKTANWAVETATKGIAFYARANSKVSIKNIMFEEGNRVSPYTKSPEDVQADINTAKLTAEQAQLSADGYMRARYVRDWLKGNSANADNHWREIKIFNKSGVNIAHGKSIKGRRLALAGFPYTNIVDNDISTYGQAQAPTPTDADWVEIDLGQVYYDIDFIQVWHYHTAAGRTYYGTKTEISEDGINWTTIFDSAIEGTYKETAEGKIHSQRWAKVMAKMNRASATTDKFSGFDGGLATAVIMEMREPSTTTRGDATAFISGMQGALKNLPAFGAGATTINGVYADAIAGIAKAIIYHDGRVKFEEAEITGVINALSGSIGHLTVEELGRVVMKDPATTKERLIFANQNIPTVAYLEDQTQDSGGGAVGALAITALSPTAYTSVVNVTQNGSTLTFGGTTLNIQATATVGQEAIVQLMLTIEKDGVPYYALEGIDLFLDSGQTASDSLVIPPTTLSGVPSGNYRLRLQSIIYYGTVSSLNASSTASTLSWVFSKNVEWFQFGLNGMMSWWQNLHAYFSNTEISFRAPSDKFDAPGVLAAGSSTSGGVQSKVWGAKSSTINITPITGGFRVPLSNMKHSNYVVQITPHTATTFRLDPTKKTNSSFEIYGSGGFDYVVIGNNYE